MANLAQNNRLARLTQAVNASISQAVGLLLAAEKGDYSGFSNAWNQDVANDGRPIGTLTASLHTADETGAGTDADIYFGIRSGTKVKEWLLDKSGYNDLEQNDSDDYYLYVGDKSITPQNIQSVYLRMGNRLGAAPDWKCDNLRVWINGNPTQFTVNRWFTAQGQSWEALLTGPGDYIRALSVNVRTGSDTGAGTDADIYFGMAAQGGQSREWLLSKAGHNDFERGANEVYNLEVNTLPFGSGAVRSYWLRMGKRMGFGPDWQCDRLSVSVNEREVVRKTVGKWFKQENEAWSQAVNGLAPLNYYVPPGH
jgi:hypothetical protein